MQPNRLLLLLTLSAALLAPAVLAEPAATGAQPVPEAEEIASLVCQAPAAAEPESEAAPEEIFASSGSCIFCSSSSQCQPICGGQVGSDFACVYDEYCEHRVCVCL